MLAHPETDVVFMPSQTISLGSFATDGWRVS